MPTKRKKNTSSTVGRTFNIDGDIHVGRDLIQGDQYNYRVVNTEGIHTTEEFSAALQNMAGQIAALKKEKLGASQLRNIEFVEGQLKESITELKGPRPQSERINTALSQAKETMDMLIGSIQSAASLGMTLGGLAAVATKLFGR